MEPFGVSELGFCIRMRVCIEAGATSLSIRARWAVTRGSLTWLEGCRDTSKSGFYNYTVVITTRRSWCPETGALHNLTES